MKRGNQKMNKALSMLGIARKAGKLEAGFDASVDCIRDNKAYLAVAASDISDKTYKNLKFEAEKMNIPVVRLNVDMDELQKACSVKAGVLVVTDESLAKAVTEKIENEVSQTKEECTI